MFKQKNSSGCCGSVNTRYYLPESEMNSVDKELNTLLTTPHFLRRNLKEILEQTEVAFSSIQDKSKARYNTDLDETQKKELLTKCLIETVNRHLFKTVATKIKQADQSYTAQPLLVAHPSSIQHMKDKRLDQLSSEDFS